MINRESQPRVSPPGGPAQKLVRRTEVVLHHYLGFLISKSHIQDLNPTFGFQKPNLAFTNLIYKRALTRVLKKNNLGFKNQIWLFKLSFENQIFQLENRISKTTFIFKTHIWFMY